MEAVVLGLNNKVKDEHMGAKFALFIASNPLLGSIYLILLVCLGIGIVRSLLSLSHKIFLVIGELCWLLLEVSVLIVMLSPLTLGCNILVFLTKRIIFPVLSIIEGKVIRRNNPIYLFLNLVKSNYRRGGGVEIHQI